jgi:hypothetical protein
MVCLVHIFASASQVNALVPFGVVPGTTQVRCNTRVRRRVVSPDGGARCHRHLSADASGTGQAVVLNQDVSPNSAENPAAPGGDASGRPAPEGFAGGIDGAVVGSATCHGRFSPCRRKSEANPPRSYMQAELPALWRG